ncbi:MAG: glycosyltransferase [Candidatus Cloacimonetes bacterium]|nr:glycosyltransferase [Candidatus Cloacimonadota bacterium]
MQIHRTLMQSKALHQFIKYVIVGCIVTVIDMLALHFSYRVLAVPIKISVIIGFMCGNVSSFVFNKYYTFRNFSPAIIRQYIKYFVTSMTGLLWTLLLMTLFYEHLNLFAGTTRYNYLLCKMIVAVMVMFWNFIIIRHWTLADYNFAYLPPLSIYGKAPGCHLSVIIPAYNEQDRLPATLNDVFAWLEKQDFSYEVLVINDGSSDAMVDTVKREYSAKPGLMLWSLPRNMGKGAAVRAGMLLAKGDYRLFMDADNQIHIDELDAFLPLVQSSRVIIGSKYAARGGSREEITASRVVVSRLGNLIIKLLLGLELKDTQCGFKLFPAELAEAVFRMQRMGRFSFDVEILSLAQLFSCEIMELPIKLYPASQSRVRTLKDSISVFTDLLKIKLNIWRRRYKVSELERPVETTKLQREF